jgi:hypothetical protein
MLCSCNQNQSGVFHTSATSVPIFFHCTCHMCHPRETEVIVFPILKITMVVGYLHPVYFCTSLCVGIGWLKWWGFLCMSTFGATSKNLHLSIFNCISSLLKKRRYQEYKSLSALPSPMMLQSLPIKSSS